MNKDNIFYVKNIVDTRIVDENKKVYTQKIVDEEKEKVKDLSDNDFGEVLIGCFIPDTYKNQGKKEKLYTKLVELMVGEWWRRLGGDFNLPTQKSGKEDVEMILNSSSVVCDAKVFRLGRSQKAPNVKDFLKLASVKAWINNLSIKYKGNNKKQNVVGGLVTYSSLHEWESDSEVYQECTDKDTHVVMLPYEILVLLLKYKNNYKLDDLLKMWNYKNIGMETSKEKVLYWKTIDSFMCDLLNIDKDTYEKELKIMRDKILIACSEYKKLILKEKEKITKQIEEKINSYTDIDSLKKYVISELDKYENAQNRDYLERIDKFRKYE